MNMKDEYKNYELIKETHDSENNALEVADYPYGFRLRTKIRYWLENTSRGTRFVSQTLNPKTQTWNTPKKSTYSEWGVMVREKATNYISWLGFDIAYADEQELKAWLDFTQEKTLTDTEQKLIRSYKAIIETRKYLTIEITHGDMTDEERAKFDLEQKKVMGKLHVIYQYHLKKENEKI